jgi:hypothetical protein
MAEKEEKVEPKYILLRMTDRPSYLIAELVEEGRDDVVLYYPAVVSVYSDEEGMQIITSKYLPFAVNDLVSIVKTSIDAIATPKETMIKFYLEFVKRWRDGGLEKILESRIIGEKQEEEHVLSTEKPRFFDTVH